MTRLYIVLQGVHFVIGGLTLTFLHWLHNFSGPFGLAGSALPGPFGIIRCTVSFGCLIGEAATFAPGSGGISPMNLVDLSEPGAIGRARLTWPAASGLERKRLWIR